MNTLAKEAITLTRLGWGVIPLAPCSKHPLLKWRALQHRKLTEREIVEIFEQTPDANLGVVTGRVSHLLVLDADAPDVMKKFGVPVTPIAETARGRHYYFTYPGTPVRSATGLADGLDLKADGGYVVSPPSVHPTGKSYEWVIPPTEAEPAPCPSWLLELLRKHRKQQNYETISEIVRGVEEGRRNVSACVLAGKLLSCFPESDWHLAWLLLDSWNEKNKPPLAKKELRRVFDKIAKRELQRRAQSESKEAQIARALRVAFTHSNLSQRQLARLSNVSQSTISRLLKTPLTQPYGVENHFEKKSGFKSAFFSKSDSQVIQNPPERG
jgi:hypothetical protein